MSHLSISKINIKKYHITGMIVWAVMLTILSLAAPKPVLAEDRVIRIGYSTDSVQRNADGTYRGYVVEYLEEIAGYTGWKYEYVYGSLAENMDKLENGELDFQGMTRYSDERKEIFLYSELPMAFDYVALCALADSDIYYQDYEAINGCRVGVLKESIYEDMFLSYMEKHGLDCELVYFTTGAEAEAALNKGSIELLTTGGLSHQPDLKLVDRFQLQPAYFITGKQNGGLMDELNTAMQYVRTENPYLESELVRKYYSENIEENLFLTREEREYLDSAAPIVVKGFSGRRPLGYETDEGVFTGVLADYLNVLSQISGLEFIHESTSVLSMEEHASRMAEEDYAIIFVDLPLDSIKSQNPVLKSTPLFYTKLSYVKRQSDEDVTGREDYVFALISEMSYLENMLLAESEKFKVLYFDTSAECMEAVVRGDADMTIQDEYVVTYLMQKPRYEDKLMVSKGSEQADGMCLYVSADQKHIINILNKTINSLSEDELTSIVTNSMLNHSYEYGLDDFLYDYGEWITLIAVMVISIFGLGSVLYIKIRNIKIQKAENEALQRQIQLDPLTGLYNRSHFFLMAREMIEKAEDEICIVRINVCNFKIVNEIYGAEKGDQLLREIARMLRGVGKDGKCIYGRFTSDHFYLCIRQDDFEALNVPRQSPMPWLGMDISLSYGVYMVGEQKDVPVNIMCDRADMANASKGQPSAEYIRYYSDEERLRLLRDQEIENEMEKAVEERQFRIFVQPKYDIETEEIVGGEVLVRWFHPEKGMIPPGEFIGLFERNGFIKILDYYIWEEGCRFISDLKKKGIHTGPLSVNVSRIHFYGWEFKDRLLSLLEKYGLQANELELEITESICAEDPEIIFEKCRELQREGFCISMDDFGSGYSSLNMLKEMPLDIIKMDLRFLSGEEDEEQRTKGRSILRTLIKLAHDLNLKVVVEGLETKEQKEFIRKIGNCYAQGYYYSKPVECQVYEDMITAGINQPAGAAGK